uniref:CC2D2A N-terminal C2 domain-containing protein n=1 Tax=Odontella aurita TaxID=265563 RepID=A0A7S4MUU7_9STRA|mmetsp:Transcript_33883/g.101095  ORF Transcript_33883/g.101095 Transcript_33883/m.101095 type:complete len:757 (+) Transcript_33883:739-3009(+)
MPRPRRKTQTALAFENATAREKKEEEEDDSRAPAETGGDSDADDDSENASTRNGGDSDAPSAGESLLGSNGDGDDDSDSDEPPRGTIQLRKAMRVRDFPVVESSAAGQFAILAASASRGDEGVDGPERGGGGGGSGGGPCVSMGAATRTFLRRLRGMPPGADDCVGDDETATAAELELEEDGFFVDATRAGGSSLSPDRAQNAIPVGGGGGEDMHHVIGSRDRCAVAGSSAYGDRREMLASRASDIAIQPDGTKPCDCGSGQSAPMTNNRVRRGGHWDLADLCIYPSRLVFTCHPEFLKEEQLYRELQTVYGKYDLLVQSEKTIFLEARLRALVKKGQSLARNARVLSEEKYDPDEQSMEGTTLRQILCDVADALRSFVDSMSEMKALEDSLWDNWRSLLRAREEQGFTCTQGVDLYHEGVPRRDVPGLEKSELLSIMNNLRRLLPQLLRHSQEATRSDSDLDIDGLELLVSAVQQLGGLNRRSVLADDLNNEDLERILQRSELGRRARIENERYFLEVIVNGKVVERTLSRQLAWPSFSIDFEKTFRCKTLHRLPSVCVRISKERFGGILRGYPLCSIFVRVPSNEPSGPTVSWYQFGSSTICARDCGLSFRGHILVATQWKRSENCHGDNLKAIDLCNGQEMSPNPLITPSDKLKLKATQFGGPVKSDKTSEPCVQPSARGSLKEPPWRFMFSGRRDFQDPALKEPMRHCLIKTREIDIMQVPSPIPLNDQSIYQDQSYHHIIRQSTTGRSKVS